MFELIEKKVIELESLLINTRRHLHRYPELSGKEVQTAAYIYEKLQEAGIEAEIVNSSAGPSVIGYIKTDESNETIAIRADIDALPVVDKKEATYSSKNEGIMHACGHDFHTASVFGTALVLAGLKENLNVNVKFIFQPAEESCNSGAEALVKEGVMDYIKAIFTLHALPTLEAGKVAVKYGTATAAVDFFKITVKGTGGHSSRPDRAVDSIYIASQIVNSLYSDITREFDPNQPVVIAVGQINGGSAPNVISETCTIEGTARTFELDIRRKLQELIRERAENIAKTYGASVDVEWDHGSPPVFNDHSLAKLVEDNANIMLGSDNVVKISKASLGAEDFSRYLDYAPGVLIRVGTGGENSSHPLHSCLFDIDESAISVAVKVLSSVAINYSASILDEHNQIKYIPI